MKDELEEDLCGFSSDVLSDEMRNEAESLGSDNDSMQ